MFPLRRGMSSDDEADVASVPVNLLGQWIKKNNTKSKKCSCKKGSKCSSKKHAPMEDKEWTAPVAPSPYLLKSKKRQNGDKTEASTSKFKRTCLNHRGIQSEWKNMKKKNGVIDHSSHLDGGLKKISLSGGDAAATSHRWCPEGNSHPESSFPVQGACGSSRSCHYDTDGGPSSSVGSSSSASNDKPSEDSALRSLALSLPSTSRGGQESTIPESDKPSSSKGVTFFDNESDSEESKYFNGYSKSGGHDPGCLRRMRKMFDKNLRRILDSDSSDCEGRLHYRPPSNFLPSDSDESSNEPVWPKKSQFLRHNPARLVSSDSDNNDVTRGPKPSTAATKRKTSKSKEKCLSSSPFEAAGTSHSELNGNSKNAPSSSHNRSGSPFLAIRSRFSRNKTSPRLSLTAHPRFLGNQRRTGVTTRSAYNQRHSELQRRHIDIPNLFEGDDSSEVEFFTAHSYSDTETSTESTNLAQADSPSSSRPQHNSTINLGESSDEDDEISVIFPMNNAKKSERSSRRGQGRNTVSVSLRRRRPSAPSNTQEAVSISPDPVAQVRQVEEDEQYARMLQAEFDAEVNQEPQDLVAPTYLSTTTTEDSDESAIIDPVSLDPPDVPIFSAQMLLPGNSSVVIRGRARVGIRTVSRPGGRRRIGRRNFPLPHGDPWQMWQFARVLGLGPASAPEVEDSEYEALIRLAERVGDAIPHGLHKSDINRLPTRKFLLPGQASTSQASEEVVHKRTKLNKECQVCLCDYEHGDILRILPCFHEFHTPCIDPWLKINNTCPVCRVEVVFDS